VSAVVFTGPTLPGGDAAKLLPGVTVLPPARQGDIFRAVRDLRPHIVGLVDGVFLHEPAVWHREILWALSEGIHVFGAASMGALRAAELCSYGMRGVGKVFEAYRDGVWPGFDDAFEDDDEVAVVHAPAELGAMPLSDAMVDLRDTLLAAESAGIVIRAERDSLCSALKAMPFPQRSFSALPDAVRAIRVARKRQDAEAMLTEMVTFLASDPPPFVAAFHFQRVHVWDIFVRSQVPEADALVLEELRLRPREWHAAARAVVGRVARLAQPSLRHHSHTVMAGLDPAIHAVAQSGVGSSDRMLRGQREPHPVDGRVKPGHDDVGTEAAYATRGEGLKATFHAFRAERGLARRADLDAWLADNAMTEADLSRLLREEAALAGGLSDVPPAAIADHLRLAGAYAPLLRRARAKQAALAGVPPLPPGPAADAALIWFAERNHIAIDALRNDSTLAAAVCREYQFQRRIS